jgi:hypothetical protein
MSDEQSSRNHEQIFNAAAEISDPADRTALFG